MEVEDSQIDDDNNLTNIVEDSQIDEKIYDENEDCAIDATGEPQEESVSQFKELISDIGTIDASQMVSCKRDPKDVYRDLKKYYFDISHDEYYAIMKRVKENVDLKKHLRGQVAIIQSLKDLPMHTSEQIKEIERIHFIIENSKKGVPKVDKFNEMLTDIEQKLNELKLFVKNEFQ